LQTGAMRMSARAYERPLCDERHTRLMHVRRSIAVLLFLLLLALGLLVLRGCREKVRQPRIEMSFQSVVFQIAETELRVHVTQRGENHLTMVNLHEDERTSVQAARVIQEKYGGRLIQLVQSGQRRPIFLLAGNRFTFDPNRIYSAAGLNATVRGPESVAVPKEAYAAVDEYASQFLDHFKLGSQRALIALHNNDEERYSIRSYQPGAPLEADTDEIFVNPAADPDDFYFVTDERFFRAFKEQGFNVILQDNRIRRDDGSLSVYSGRRGIPYINVEAQNEHFDEQVRMLDAAVGLIESVIEKR
jgi:hypothetical protein